MRHGIARASFSILLLLSPFAAASGCVYDWTIGATSADAGPEGGTGGTGGSGGSGGGAPDGSVDGAGCDALLADVNDKRNAAKACTLGASGQCTGTVTDECGCTSYVEDPNSAATKDFSAAIDALKSAGCTPSCGPSCSPSIGACLLSAGKGPYCVP
jgi:hypothetical protein